MPASRREFLKVFGAAAAATAIPFGDISAQEETPSGASKHRQHSSGVDFRDHRDDAYEIRVKRAHVDRKVAIPDHNDNGDEALYSNRIGNYSKGLPHDSLGEVDANAYNAYLAAIVSGDPSDFENIPVGGTVLLFNPQSGLAFDLEGLDVVQTSSPPAPPLASPDRAAEAVELYWQAVTRDVLISNYDSDPNAQAAATELSNLSAFKGPRDPQTGQVTGATLFRGFTAGDLLGPYVSQFLILPFSYGPTPATQGYKTDLPLSAGGSDYLTSFASWLAAQNGQGPFASAHPDSVSRFPRSGRDLAAYVHVDQTYQPYLYALMMLAKMGAPVNPASPYHGSKSQVGGVTFGIGAIEWLLAEVTLRATKASFFEKWFVHRTLRPEEFGGLVHNTLTNTKQYPLDPTVLNSGAVQKVFSANGTYLLPQEYPEGCPQHPSYPEAHGAIAGAAATLLKWFFDETFVIPNPKVPSDDGLTLNPYLGADAGQLTVGGEINKLASNIGIARTIAGIHWRSDYELSMLLGEAVAVSVLADLGPTYNESYPGFSFTKFDGTKVTV